MSSNNESSDCQCSDNNFSNLSLNHGGSGGIGDGGGGAGVGGGGGGQLFASGGDGTCSINSGGIFIDTTSDGNNINSCNCSTDNADNLAGNQGGAGGSSGGQAGESIGNGGANVSATPGGIGIGTLQGAGIYLDANCNTVNGCDCIGNVNWGIQLSNTGDQSAANNLIMSCSVNGATGCTGPSNLGGIGSYATGINTVDNNLVRYCLTGYMAQADNIEVYEQNCAFFNTTEYVDVTPTGLWGNPTGVPGVNIQHP